MGARPTFRVLVAIAGFAVCALAAAEADSRQMIRLPSSPEEKAVKEAVELLGQGKLDEADRVFSDLLTREPGSVVGLLGRAQVTLGVGAAEKAEKQVRAVIAANPKAAEAHNMLGVTLLAQGRSDEAGRAFDQALTLRPTYITPRAHLAALARMTENWAEAERQFRELIRLAPREPFGHVGLAELMLVRKGVTEGLAVLDDWKRTDPKASEPYAFKAEVCAAQNMKAEAIREIGQAVSMSPPSAHAFRVQGDLLATEKDWKGAMAAYDRAISLRPEYFDALVRLGSIYAEQGLASRAIETFKKVTVLMPGYAPAFNNLAYLRAGAGDTSAETVALVERALALAPAYGEAMHTLGHVRLLRGEYALAVKALTDARARIGDRYDVLMDLGASYEKLGRKTEASAAYTKALPLAPPGEKAKVEQALKRVTSPPGRAA